MYQEFYRNSELLNLPLYTLIFFVAVFLGVVVWVFAAGRNNPHFDRMAELPLGAESIGGKRDE